jgi:hypothetical protein
MYRLVDCGTWDDPWFESLEPHGKLFFLYLLTNPRSTSCGAFEITPRKMAFETSIPPGEIDRFLSEWTPLVQWWPEHQIIFIKNFYRRQNNNERVRVNASRIVAGMPQEVQQAVWMVYPELKPPPDTLSIDHPYPIHRPCINVTKRDVTTTATATATATESIPRHVNGNGRHAAAASKVLSEIGDESIERMASKFYEVNPQLDEAWLRATLVQLEAQGMSLPPPELKTLLQGVYLKAEDALGRENTIRNPPAWARKQIEQALGVTGSVA